MLEIAQFSVERLLELEVSLCLLLMKNLWARFVMGSLNSITRKVGVILLSSGKDLRLIEQK